MSELSRAQLVDELFSIYKQTSHLLMRSFQEVMEEQLPYGSSSIVLLKTLSHHDGATQHELAEVLHISDAAVSRQIGILVEEGCVTTESDPDNRRVTRVFLTDKGREAAATIKQAMRRYLNELLEPVSDEQLLQVLESNKALCEVLLKQTEGERHVSKK